MQGQMLIDSKGYEFSWCILYNYLYTVQVTIWSEERVFKIWLIRLLVKALGDFFLAEHISFPMRKFIYIGS